MEKKLIKYCFGFSEKREFDENRGVIMFFAVLDVIGLIILCFGRYFPKIRDWIPENYWIVGFFRVAFNLLSKNDTSIPVEPE